MASHPHPAPKVGLPPKDTEPNAKTMQELSIPWNNLKKDPEKICKLVDFILSLFEGKNTVVLPSNKITFLYNALYAMLHVLFMPRELLQKGMEIVLDRIIEHRITKSDQWMVFDIREVSYMKNILVLGRWTFSAMLNSGKYKSIRSESLFDTFSYHKPKEPQCDPAKAPPERRQTDNFAKFSDPSLYSQQAQLERELLEKSTEVDHLRIRWHNTLLYAKELRHLYSRFISARNRQIERNTGIMAANDRRIKELCQELASKDCQLKKRSRQIVEDDELMENILSESEEYKCRIKDLTSDNERLTMQYQIGSVMHDKALGLVTVATERISQLEAELDSKIEERTKDHEREINEKEAELQKTMKQIARLELELDLKNEELMKPHEFRNRQQERHEREIKEKDAEVQKANEEMKLAKKALSRYKQTQKQTQNLETAIFDLKNQLEAKELALGMAIGNNEDTEARAAAAEAEVLSLKNELETLKTEKENFQAEKNRLLAFRTNPEAEKDRIEKAVREAITSKAIELIDKDSEIKTLKGEIRGKKNEIRRQKAELETYERGRIVDQNMLRELSGDTYRLKTSLKDAELYHTGLEDRIFGLEQKLADTEAAAEILKSELQMFRAKQKLTFV